jgi:pyruvate dehydrogenase E2 component (dihydrolipoamide acetyltransferase)
MPALGMAQDSGLLISWLKNEGDTVRKGEPLMEVETDKATVEIEAEADGILAGVTAAAGDDVPVGTVIAFILAAGETLPGSGQLSNASVSPVSPGAPTVELNDINQTSGNGKSISSTPVAARVAGEHHVDLNQVPAHGRRITKSDVLTYLQQGDGLYAARRRIAASPLARRLAREGRIDLQTLRGSGPGGALLAADVRTALTAPAVTPPNTPAARVETTATQAPATAGRRWLVMAERMEAAWRSVPHFYLQRDIDVTELLAWHARIKARAEVKVTVTDLLIKLAAAALRRHPRLNASWVDGAIVDNATVNIGLAVAVPDGLLVPVIHDADKLGVNALAVRRRELVDRTLADKLKPADLQGGTFTLSNLGMYHVDTFNAIINPPQVAILAVGQIAERVVAVEGQAAVRPVLALSLSCDHRVVDGARGAEFLETLAGYLQEPLAMLD